jgi:hypothetical protein
MANIRQAFGEESMSHIRKAHTTKTEKAVTGEEQSQEHDYQFFDIKGIVHKEFTLAGQTVYSDVLQ